MRKDIGFIGLGKMGRNMVQRLLARGWRVAVFDANSEAVRELAKKGAKPTESLMDLASKLIPPRIIWLMLPSAKSVKGTRLSNAVDEVLFRENGLISYLEKGDIIVEGGNSYFEDSIERAKKLSKKGIEFLDAGVSGGPQGAKDGAALMVGGKRIIYERIKPLFEVFAVPGGLAFFDGVGAGHFLKMVHNGIEYGMMQSIAEGFNLLEHAPYKVSLKKVAEVYGRGSVIESRLIYWLKKAFEQHGEELRDVTSKVAHTGETEWMVQTARRRKIPVKAIEDALSFRVQSAKKQSYTGKILSALREQFGGHKVIR